MAEEEEEEEGIGDSDEHQQVPAIPLHAIPRKLLCLTGHSPAEVERL